MDLFEKLKAEPAVNKYGSGSSPPKTSNGKAKTNILKETASQRRVSLPATTSLPPPKKKAKKSRSVSPYPEQTSNSTKKVKVMVSRVADVQSVEKTKGLPTKQSASSSKKVAPIKAKPVAKVPTSPSTSPPTKAQKKLFEPPVLKKVTALTKRHEVKRCVVRIKRDNLKELQASAIKKVRARQKKEIKVTKAKVESPPKSAAKSLEFYIKLPAKPVKRVKDSKKSTGYPTPQKSSVSPPLSAKLSRKISTSPTTGSKASRTTLGSHSTKIDKKSHNVTKKKQSGAFAKGSRPNRLELIKSYGKRVFNSVVKIKRCKHPLMLIFESNARAQRLLAKPRKSKNLSVSFKEQVEIFGDSSDSDNCDDDVPSTSKKLLVTPARLSKVENGKIIGEFELDSSLYVDPKQTSTPLSVARKKREKKSFSPLKDDGTPSPRKEHLKLANEKLPPSGLRRLNIEDMDDEDENDDECEYIVPIEIPPRRISQTSTSSATAAVEIFKPVDDPPAKPIVAPSLKPVNDAILEPIEEAPVEDAGKSTLEAVEKPTPEASEQQPPALNEESPYKLANESLPKPVQMSPSGSVESLPSNLADSQDKSAESRVDSSESFISAEGEPTVETIKNSFEVANKADVAVNPYENDLANPENQPKETAGITADTNGNGEMPTFLNDMRAENEEEENALQDKKKLNNNRSSMDEDMDLHLFVEDDMDAEDSLLMASPNVEREVNEMLATLPKDVGMTDIGGEVQTDSANADMLHNADALDI